MILKLISLFSRRYKYLKIFLSQEKVDGTFLVSHMHKLKSNRCLWLDFST